MNKDIANNIPKTVKQFLGLTFVADSLLLPMFHVGGLPVKPSYVVLLIGVLYILLYKKKIKKSFLKISISFILIIISALLGEVIISLRFSNVLHTETAWSITIYLLCVFSYCFTWYICEFNFNWLCSMMLLAILLNLLLIFLSNVFPFLANFYYSQKTASDIGLNSVEEVFNMLRPRGLFGNPNISMLQINIIYLFVIVGVKARLCKPPNGIKLFLCILMPILLAFLLGSRSELLVSCFYSIYFCRVLWGYKSFFYISLMGFVLIVSLFVLSSILEKSTGFEKSDMLTYATSRITKTNDELFTTEDDTQGIKRPLIMFEYALRRFLFSPLVGTGFNSVENTYPFNESPRYYHNDWFRVLATSGIIGILSLLYFLYKFPYKLNPILLTPFIFPALTNTFLLSIPSVMFYFFMLGIIYKHKNISKIDKYYCNESD